MDKHGLIYSDRYLKVFLGVQYGSTRAIEFIWSDMGIGFEDIKTAHKLALEVAVQYGVRTLIARIEKAKTNSTLSNEICVWWATIWVKKLIKNNIRRIITVHKAGTLDAASMKLNAKKWILPLKAVNIDNCNTEDYAKAVRGILPIDTNENRKVI